MDLVPEFPDDGKMILLTESAKYDPAIVLKYNSVSNRVKCNDHIRFVEGSPRKGYRRY